MNHSRFEVALFVCSALALSGCSNAGTDPGGVEKGVGNGGSLYAVMYEIFGPEDSTSYLAILDSLSPQEIDVRSSAEYAGGRAFLRSYNGWVFVGDAGAPEVTRYSVAEDGALKQDLVMNLGNYGFTAGEIDEWTTTFVSPTKAYTVYAPEALTVVWNPTTMKITGEIEGPEGVVRSGWRLEGSPGAPRGNRLFRTFDWVNDDEQTYQKEQLLAVYDTENDTLLDVVDEPRCSAMGNLVHSDEGGNLYFSNWIWPVGNTLMNGAQKSCVLRIGPESERFDSDWQLTYADATDGREGAMFTYLKDDKAIIAVFHDELASRDDETLPNEYVGNEVWRLWNYDLATQAAAPLESIDFNTGAFTPVNVDGHALLMVPGADWASTQIFDVADDDAEPTIYVPGWTYQLAKVR